MTERFVRRRYIVDWGLQGNLLAHGLLYGGLSLVADLQQSVTLTNADIVLI